MGAWEEMKTTLEIPDPLFRRAKSAAARQGIAFRELVTQALAEKLNGPRNPAQPWMKSFGKLRTLRHESARISELIEQEFGSLEPEDLQ
jgi:hypothetical protein